jgi:hypothetical protein
MSTGYDMRIRPLHLHFHRGIWLLLCFLPLLSCNPDGSKKLNKRVTFWRKDKIPYGTFVAYESLPSLFPHAEISVSSTNFSTLAQQGGKKKALIFIGHYAEPDAGEINGLLNFVGQGNHVFLSALHFGDTLLHTLNLRLGANMDAYSGKDSLGVNILQPGSYDSLSFTYPGEAYGSWLDSLDQKYTTVLGRDARGRPNLVRFSYKGGGSLFLQFAPMAFTNFFLLHKNNKAYYDNVFSYIPGNVNEVLWDESLRYDSNGNNGFSALRFIMKNDPLRIGFWLLMLLLLLIYLFESKRRQRIVPVIDSLRNNSLDFVRTIGRLYYQRRDNQNLVMKMATHFQDYIRTRYNLSVQLSDVVLVERLAYKTGIAKEFLHELTEDIMRLQSSQVVLDEELLGLNKKLEEFYKQA